MVMPEALPQVEIGEEGESDGENGDAFSQQLWRQAESA
jgi:hypothetical protein